MTKPRSAQVDFSGITLKGSKPTGKSPLQALTEDATALIIKGEGDLLRIEAISQKPARRGQKEPMFSVKDMRGNTRNVPLGRIQEVHF